MSSSSSGTCLEASDFITGREEICRIVTLFNFVFTTQVVATASATSSSPSSPIHIKEVNMLSI